MQTVDNTGLSNSSNEALTIGISIYNPLHSSLGSPALFYTQGIISGKIWGAPILLSGIAFFLAVVNKFFCLDKRKMPIPENTRLIQVTLKELQDFLSYFKGGSPAGAGSDIFNFGMPNQAEPGEFGSTAEDSIIVAFSAWSQYSTLSYTPNLMINLPLFTLPGARGPLPILILETLSTIFVRAVVPPYNEAATDCSDPKPLEITTDQLLNVIQRFGHYFKPK